MAVLLFILAWNMPSQPNKATNDHANRSNDEQALGPGYYESALYQEAADTPNKTDDDPPHWYAALKRPEWWAIIGLFATLFILIWQTYETRKAAKSALLNAQAIINAERAWMAVTVESSPIANSAPFFISYLNQGRTPAKIVGEQFAHRFVKLPDDLPVPVKYPDVMFPPENTFIVSKDSFRSRPGFDPESILNQNGKKDVVITRSEFLMFYGRIVYEDVFASGKDGVRVTHETRWCYAYIPDGEKRFTACGPDEYNGYA
jgi:hypothetical protein